MDRRDFLKAVAIAPAAAGAARPERGPASILTYTAEQHRRRLLNIAECERSIRKCLRRHHITSYIPGHALYNLGEYPCRKPYEIGTDYDEAELDRLQKQGIRLIQIQEEWNDLLRLFGGDKFTAVNPRGLRRLIKMAHSRGIKVLLYISTGFMQAGDPDLRQEWVRRDLNKPGQYILLRQAHWKLVRCSPASAGWRAYLLSRTQRVLDDYDLDGLFNDWGYTPLYNHRYPPTKDEVLAFEEAADHDAAAEDLVALVYSEVKRRGGIYKMHTDRNSRPMFESQLYDYLIVGEAVQEADKAREGRKDYPPYVTTIVDYSSMTVSNEDEAYLHAIPYMQFPVLLAGRPMTGEKSVIPGVDYRSEKEDGTVRRWRSIWRHYQAHPDGPYIYGHWDAFPPRPNARAVHAEWLKRYLPMVEEGTRAYLEIADSSLFSGPLPANTVASAFANLNLYLVLANYGTSEAVIETSHVWAPAEETGGIPGSTWKLAPRSMKILVRTKS